MRPPSGISALSVERPAADLPNSLDLVVRVGRCGRLLLGGAIVAALSSAPLRSQELRYTVALREASAARTLVIQVTGSGFDKRDSLVAVLPNWGEWSELPRPYLQDVLVNNRGIAPVAAGTILLGAGSFNLQYQIPVLGATSDDARRYPLLPQGAADTVIAAVRNTLVEIRRNGTRVGARASLQIVAPLNGGTFTGWAGFAAGSQSAPIVPLGANENGFFVFGVSAPEVRRANGIRIEVVSATRGTSRARDVAELATRVLPVLQHMTHQTPDTVVRLIIQQSPAPRVSRGTQARFGITIAVPPDDAWSEQTRALVAHELAHLWIGQRFAGDRLLWFTEGFTDYLALFSSTASGIVSPNWFAQRLFQIADDLAALPPSPRHPLTTSETGTRDDGGPAERLAYRGGALAAFRFDVALRAARKGSLGGFIGRLIAQPDSALSEGAIYSAAEALGVAAELKAAVDSSLWTASPSVALGGIGFIISKEPTSLVALGLAADAAGRAAYLTMGPAVVRAIDPFGPSAAANILPGDTISIRSDRRPNPPTHDAAITAATLGGYTFASSVVPSGSRSVTLEVRRNGEMHTVTITPRLVRGGLRLSATWDSSSESRFFMQ